MEHQNLVYDKELVNLKNDILKMGGVVEELIFRAVESLKNRDKKMASDVIKQDAVVDQLELDIDEQCINLIALRQPKAGDLRFITTGMRIATDLERIGDLAEDIAQRSLQLADHGPLKPLIDIPKMTVLVLAVLKIVLDAFINEDTSQIKNIWNIEREVDGLRDLVHEELVLIMTKNPLSVSRAIPLLLISRHLERISDHATNIAEDVIYMVEAKIVKHSGRIKE